MIEHDLDVLKTLAATMIDRDPHFEIMPATKAGAAKVAEHPFQATDVGPPMAQ